MRRHLCLTALALAVLQVTAFSHAASVLQLSVEPGKEDKAVEEIARALATKQNRSDTKKTAAKQLVSKKTSAKPASDKAAEKKTTGVSRSAEKKTTASSSTAKSKNAYAVQSLPGWSREVEVGEAEAGASGILPGRQTWSLGVIAETCTIHGKCKPISTRLQQRIEDAGALAQNCESSVYQIKALIPMGNNAPAYFAERDAKLPSGAYGKLPTKILVPQKTVMGPSAFLTRCAEPRPTPPAKIVAAPAATETEKSAATVSAVAPVPAAPAPAATVPEVTAPAAPAPATVTSPVSVAEPAPHLEMSNQVGAPAPEAAPAASN